MDFDAYQNPPMPMAQLQKPVRPSVKSQTPDSLRKYADDLEVYETKLATFRKLREGWRAECEAVQRRFQADALEEVGLTGHPKAEKVWQMAWEHGHGGGFREVFIWLEELAEVVL